MNWYEQIHHMGPAFVLLAGAVLVLTIDLIAMRRAELRWIALLVTGVALAYNLQHALTGVEGDALAGAIVVDGFSIYFAFLILAVTAAVIILTAEGMAGIDRRGEFYALILTSAAAMLLLAQGQDLILIFIALETTSVAQFVLVGLARDDRSSEAGLKYLLTGAVAAAVLLYGFGILFGLSGGTSLDVIAEAVRASGDETRLAFLLGFALVAAGFGFKIAIVPFHAWAPDVYQGAPTVVTSFLSVASKAAGFAVLLRVFYVGLGGPETPISHDWSLMFAALAAASMLFGNIGALLQTNAKRLLGYSSIAQAGNIAIGLAAVAAGSTVGPSAVLFYLGAYAATNIGVFVCVHIVAERAGTEDIRDYAGLFRRSPAVAAVLLLCLLSLTGLPPTAGFLAKLYVFNSAVQTGEDWLVWLVVIGVINTAISAYYYLRWARTLIMAEPSEATPIQATGAVQGLLAISAVGVLFFGVAPSWLIDAARQAADNLL